MCKCGVKSEGISCNENKEAVKKDSEQTPAGNCTGNQHKSGDCCSTKVV